MASKWDDVEYAKIAYLYTQLLATRTLKTTEELAKVMDVPLSTAKERVRACREHNFLTKPGKGQRSQSVITLEAMKVLSGI
jgi:hypothetical protein